jgi:hypothetical protein
MSTSIFIFNENQDPLKNTIEEVHFNYCNFKKGTYLDIGIKILPENGSKIFVYVPWENAETPIDLYDIIKNQDVLKNIFNEHITTHSTSSHSYIEVTSSNNIIFNLVTITSTLDPITNNCDYTKFVININHPNGNTNPSYIRFRFDLKEKNTFYKINKNNDFLVNPYKESTKMIDFRINEIRMLPANLINNLTTPEIKKLHVFLIMSYKQTNILSNPSFIRCRNFENDDSWKKYFSNYYNNDDAILAYHWRKENIKKGEHYCILSIFSEKNTSWLKILLYFTIIITLNLSSSYFYDKIKDYIKIYFPEQENKLNCNTTIKHNENKK